MKTLNLKNISTGDIIPLDLPDVFGKNYAETVSSVIKEKQSKYPNDKFIITKELLPIWKSQNVKPPETPKPSNPDHVPPEESSKKVISSTVIDPASLYLQSASGNFVTAQIPLYPPRPVVVFLQYSIYWKQLGYASISGPQDYTKEITWTNGMSASDIEVYSAQLGIAKSRLSEKLSKTFGYSINVNTEKTVKSTYHIHVPKEKTKVFMLWQLVEEFLFVDSLGKPLDWTAESMFLGQMKLTNEPRINLTDTLKAVPTTFPSIGSTL